MTQRNYAIHTEPDVLALAPHNVGCRAAILEGCVKALIRNGEIPPSEVKQDARAILDILYGSEEN